STLSNLDDRTLAGRSAGLGAPMWPNGQPFAAADLDDAWLVAVGDGQYRVSVTDPATDGVTFLRGAGPDGLFLLDLTIPPPPDVATGPRTAAEARAAHEADVERMRQEALDSLPQIKGLFERAKQVP